MHFLTIVMSSTYLHHELTLSACLKRILILRHSGWGFLSEMCDCVLTAAMRIVEIQRAIQSKTVLLSYSLTIGSIVMIPSTDPHEN